MIRVMGVRYRVSVCGVVIQGGAHLDVRPGVLRDAGQYLDKVVPTAYIRTSFSLAEIITK